VMGSAVASLVFDFVELCFEASTVMAATHFSNVHPPVDKLPSLPISLSLRTRIVLNGRSWLVTTTKPGL
jgi:hypothetical protein